MSTTGSAIPKQIPRLLETRHPKDPHRVRVAPEPLWQRQHPRLEWAAAGAGWEEAMWQARSGYEISERADADGCSIAIPLGMDRGAEPESELAEAGAR
jgi:hypothetical protein